MIRNYDFVKCFDSIHDILEISDFGQKIVLFHYPMVEWNSYFRGSYLIYGHIHNNVSNRAYQIMKDEKRALNAGADITGFKPVNFETLIACNNAFNEKFGV